MDYDFNLGANQGAVIDTDGTFVKYKSGTGKILVTTSKGDSFSLVPGQGFRNAEFHKLTIRDQSNAANAGVLHASSAEFIDDNMSGSIAVSNAVEALRVQVLNKQVFSFSAIFTGLASLQTQAQVWNPSGNTKNLLVRGVRIATTGAASLVWLSHDTVRMTNSGAASCANVYGGQANSSGQIWWDRQAVTSGVMADILSVATTKVETFEFPKPFVVSPNRGLNFTMNANAQDLWFAPWWSEE